MSRVVKWVVAAGVLGVIGWIASVLLADTPEKHAQRVDAAILRQCQNAIRSLARFGDSDRPGAAMGVRSNGRITFEWPEGSFYFLQGDNTRAAQSARCIARLDTQTIIFLQLRDKVIVDDRSAADACGSRCRAP
jgi:hypothetical protein